MGKIVNEDGVLWYVEKKHMSGIWHIGKKYIGLAEKPKEDKKVKTTKKGEDK